jgi:HEAT repeat protein
MSSRLIAFLVSLVFVACSSTQNDTATTEKGATSTNPLVKQRLQARVDNIKYQKGTTLVSNLERIAAYGDMAIPVCLEGLKDENAMTRMGCAYVLGRIGNTQVVPDLQAALDDKVAFVRYEVASQLGTLGSRAGYRVLVAGLSDANIRYRFKCFEALHQLTGHSHNATPERREVSVEQWNAWLEQLESEEV